MKGKDLRPVVYLKKGKNMHKVPGLYGGETGKKAVCSKILFYS